MLRIIFYQTDDGKEPALEYLRTLNEKQFDKVYEVFRLIQEEDGRVPRQFFSQKMRSTKMRSTDGLWEIRVSFAGDAFRFLSFFDRGALIVVAHGFTKKTQKTPRKEIRTAEQRKKDYERR